jgi:hypothetical protein
MRMLKEEIPVVEIRQSEGGGLKYEKPVLIVMGNLNDLVAGTGTQQVDSGLCNGVGGTFVDC